MTATLERQSRATYRQHVLELLTVRPCLTGAELAHVTRRRAPSMLVTLAAMERDCLVRKHEPARKRVGKSGMVPATWTLRHLLILPPSSHPFR